MAIPKRGGGISPRGSGGSGGGKITVKNTSGGEETELGVGITELVWATQDGLGFGATIDPENPQRVIIGDPPVFSDPVSWASSQNTPVRVAESDTNEADTYLTGGKENTTVMGSLGDFRYSTTIGRGFGPDSRLTVKTYHAGVLVDDVTFTCAGNGVQNDGNVSITVTSYEEDGDGSAFKGRVSVAVNSFGVIGSSNSGMCRVEISFLEQKWGNRRNISQDVFKDKNVTTPSINAGSTVRDHDNIANHVMHYVSGIAYFTKWSEWQYDVVDISNLSDDSSHPNKNLTVDASEFGIVKYDTSPWGVDAAEWLNITNLDTVSDVGYLAARGINTTDFRHVGPASVKNTVRDSWNESAVVESNTLDVCIDTNSQLSTDTVEYFTRENMRLANVSFDTPWNSKQYCLDGDAIFFGGKLMQGSDLPTIYKNAEGSLGTAGNLRNYLPDRDIDGNPRLNPNYSYYQEPAVFNRKFFTGTASSYATMNMNILTNGDLASQLANGDIKIYIWKLDSIDSTSPNLNAPTSYNPLNPLGVTNNSLWAHASYDFGAFDEGVSQTAGGSGMITNQAGNLLSLTFSGYNVIEGVLVSFHIEKGTTIDEVSVTFA